ncbi:MAG: ROK family protein [Lachnospiraceae bacterium]
MAVTAGQNSINTKQYNRGLILKLIATGTCRSRIELARTTGLTKMTISNIISEFMQGEVIEEYEVEQTENCGRNPIVLRVSEHAPKIIGVLVFRGRLEAIISSMTLGILYRERYDLESDLTAERLMEHIYGLIERCLEREHNVIGIGVSVIGPVDLNRGILLNPPRFYGIQNLHILELLRQRYDLPVVLEHDNNSAALAEKMFGHGRDASDFIFLGISNGIGSGVILNGEIFHNAKGLAPEIGFMTINRNGPTGKAGKRGYLEMYASTGVVEQQLQLASGINVSFSEFCRMTDRQEVADVFEELVENVSIALVDAVNLLHPEMIILGHDCIDWDDRFVKKLEELVNKGKIAQDYRKIPICKAFFGRDAMLTGSAAVILDRVFKGQLPLM